MISKTIGYNGVHNIFRQTQMLWGKTKRGANWIGIGDENFHLGISTLFGVKPSILWAQEFWQSEIVMFFLKALRP